MRELSSKFLKGALGPWGLPPSTVKGSGSGSIYQKSTSFDLIKDFLEKRESDRNNFKGILPVNETMKSSISIYMKRETKK